MAHINSPYRYFVTDPDVKRKQIIAEVIGDQYPGAFSATDITALMNLPWGEVRPFGTLAAVSISTHRDVFPVTSMPYVGARGFTQGHRTVAGTMMFNTIDHGVFTPILDTLHQHPDELPLFDILFTYANEVGMLSFEQLIGVRLLDFGKTVALENLQPIESYSYMALDYVTLKSLVGREDVAKKVFTLQRNNNRAQQKLSNSDGQNKTIFDPTLYDYTGKDPFPENDPASSENVNPNSGSGNPSSI